MTALLIDLAVPLFGQTTLQMPSMSDATAGILAALSAEFANLARTVTPATAIVTGQLKDFSEASGSGWLVDELHLVTNFHVVDGLETPIHVRMPEHPQIVVELVGSDSFTDLAVLALPEPIAGALTLRRDPPRLGELCFAFGSPLGQYPESMTMGIVSGLRRRIQSPGGRMIEDALQTDAAINHGNSGGPLTDVSGCVLGVNSQGIDNASNIGFVVPASIVCDIVPELLAYGEIVRASLGLTVAPTVLELSDLQEERLCVSAIRPQCCGSFEIGDVLISVAGVEIHTRGDLLRVLRRDLVDTDVTVQIIRAGVNAELVCRPPRFGAEPVK
jgi:S1-C subfamily serine protease